MGDLDGISVLPKMRSPKEKDRIFKLIWVLDLELTSTRQCIHLIFKNVDTGYFHIDSIPPELLAYCSVGSYFRNGEKLPKKAEGQKKQFSIHTTEGNRFFRAQDVFSDSNYDLSLNEKMVSYSAICKKQFCFIQSIGHIKFVIPSFVIAATYYFKSTSLREAILRRKLTSLFYSCSINHEKRLASIKLKPEGNLGDASNIARLWLDEFAKQRIDLCANHAYANKHSSYSQLFVDFPVSQSLPITARGSYSKNDDGSETFIVFEFLMEGSVYPFDSIDVQYEAAENGQAREDQKTIPQPKKEHSGQMTNRSPSSGLVRHILENTTPAQNDNLKSIIVNRIPTAKNSHEEQKSSTPIYGSEKVDLSSQPSAPGDGSVARGDIQEQNQEPQTKFEFSLDLFMRMAGALLTQAHKVGPQHQKIPLVIHNFNQVETLVCKRNEEAITLTRKESYDKTENNRRKCAYIWFSCLGRHICLIEIDQRQIGNARCSTRILISDSEIPIEYAEACVRDYVLGDQFQKRVGIFKGNGITLIPKKHPPNGSPESLLMWQTGVITEIYKRRGIS